MGQDFVNAEREWALALNREFDMITYTYGLRLKAPVIVINQSSQLLGSWNPELRQIAISSHLIRTHGWTVTVEVFKHELAHLIVTELLCSFDAHGPDFQRACDLIAVEQWARSPKVDIPGELRYWRDSEPTNEESRLRRRAEKLLALATSSNEHEALLAMEKVREIYRTFNLDHWRHTKRADFVSLTINHRKKKIPAHQSMIASILSSHFFVRIIFATEFCPVALETYKTLEMMGTRENVLMAEYVYWFLTNNLKVLWEAYRRQSLTSGIVKKGNFYLGVLVGFREKLDLSAKAQAVEEVKNQTSSEVTAVLRIADRALSSYVKRRFPKLRTSSAGGGGRSDSESFEAGRSAGRDLNLNRGISKSGTSGRLLLGART
jgi:hypothetical protein